MRLACWLTGGCQWVVLKEEWIDKTQERPYSQLVRFYECRCCKDTKATLTSPDDGESLFSVPNEFNKKEVIA